VSLVAACSSDDGHDSAAGPAPAASSATPSTEPVEPSTTTTAPLAAPGVTLVDRPADVEPPDSAGATAAVLRSVERALRDPATPADALPSLGWHQQAAYRVLAAHRGWLPDVTADLPADIAAIVERNVGGGISIATLVEPPATLPTAWTIEQPPPPEELLGYYREAERASGIPWPYIAAINFVETRVGRIVGDSTAGAKGPMQFIDSTWDAYGEGGDVRDPRDAILAAGRYLAAAGGPADMRAALFAYNHSDAYVDAVTRYAQQMIEDERAYLGYYQWQVTYRTVDGLYLLPEGYPERAAVRLS
jgi:hypothetical protein